MQPISALKLVFFAACLAVFSIPGSSLADPLKCSACEAVAAELGERLANERPRNSLDVRHRLDKDGNRYGKVIDFKVSELRAVELLEDLCTEMKKYVLGSEDGEEVWELSAEEKSADGDGAQCGDEGGAVIKGELKEQRRVLENSCSDIVGKWEEELMKGIKEGKLDPGSVQGALCVDLGKYCAERRGGGEGGDGGGRIQDEL